tara:strand:- start:36390 stop:38408 length:2019 start_codon:yes stop_codon:yes gene_type:complete
MPTIIQLDNSSIRMKVVANFQQPKLYLNKNVAEIPPTPSFKADSYLGSDMGYVEKFSIGVHAISPHVYSFGSIGWDQTDSRVISNSYPPIVGSLLSYNQGSIIHYNRFTHNFTFPGITPSTSSLMRLDSGTILAHSVNPASPNLLSSQSVPFQFGIPNYGVSKKEPKIKSHITSHDLSKIKGKHDVCGTSPEDLADYSKSLTKFVVCEPVLEGDKFRRFHNEIDDDLIMQVVEDDPINFLVLRPRALWSMEKNYGPQKVKKNTESNSDDNDSDNSNDDEKCGTCDGWDWDDNGVLRDDVYCFRDGNAYGINGEVDDTGNGGYDGPGFGNISNCENNCKCGETEPEDNQEQDCDCHVYPKKQKINSDTGLTELVDDDCYRPIDPAYFNGAEIFVERLIDPVIVSTNPEIVQLVKNNKCFDNIIAIEVDGELFEYVVADFIDTNNDARKRGGSESGVPDGYDPLCITLCDAEGNEKEGLILFKEEDCIEKEEGEVPPTIPPTNPPTGPMDVYGACCYRGLGEGGGMTSLCDDKTESDCNAVFGTWHDEFSSCTSSGYLFSETAEWRDSFGSLWTCPDTFSQGACCTAHNYDPVMNLAEAWECRETSTQADCEGYIGASSLTGDWTITHAIWKGAGTTCDYLTSRNWKGGNCQPSPWSYTNSCSCGDIIIGMGVN